MRFWITMGVLFMALITSGVVGKNCGVGWQKDLMVMGETVFFWTLSVALVRRGFLKMRATFHRQHLLSLSIREA
jgi:hypothetical protein